VIGIDHQPGELPGINTRVDVHGRWDRWVPSRVEDTADGALLLAAPATVDYEIQPRLGDPVDIQWVTARGVAQVTGVVEDVSQDTALRLWRVRLTSKPVTHQRRRYVRADVLLPVVVERTVEGGTERVEALTVDISEGGVQLVIQPPDLLPRSAFVVVHLTLDGAAMRLSGDVLQSRERPDGGHTVIVRFFDVRAGDADRIRRFAFSSQVRSVTGRGR
jgi:hypothetical protein